MLSNGMLPRIVIHQPASVNPGGEGPRTPFIANVFHVLYILYWLEVGVALLLLPWMSIWDNNYLLYLYPQFRPLVINPFFKGGVLGLGIVNILIGIHEVVYRKRSSKNIFHR